MKSKIAIGLVLLICTLTVNSPANAGEPLKKKPCSTGGRCQVGDVGPSGGYIFSIPSTPGNTTGKTFELAPRNWSGAPTDPSVPWCNAATVAFTATTSTQFGTGAANTQAMLTACTSGAANTVIAYRGGGNSDWYLPSVGEAVQIMKMQAKPAIKKRLASRRVFGLQQLRYSPRHRMNQVVGFVHPGGQISTHTGSIIRRPTTRIPPQYNQLLPRYRCPCGQFAPTEAELTPHGLGPAPSDTVAEDPWNGEAPLISRGLSFVPNAQLVERSIW